MTFDIHSTGSCLHVGFLWFLRKTALVTAIVHFLLWLGRLNIHSTESGLHVNFLLSIHKVALVTAIVLFLYRYDV